MPTFHVDAAHRQRNARAEMDVERFLWWAYREELPKRPYPCHDPFARLIALGARVDDERWGDEPGILSETPPHPDALLADRAVRMLEDIEIDWPATRGRIMGEFASWARDDDPALACMRFQLCALVVAHAQMASRPQWDVGPVKVTRVQGRNGKAVIHGITKGRRYAIGAQSPLQLDPPAAEIACARAEYAAWYEGLCRVTQTLASWNLTEHTVRMTDLPAEPWVTGPPPNARIWREN